MKDKVNKVCQCFITESDKRLLLTLIEGRILSIDSLISRGNIPEIDSPGHITQIRKTWKELQGKVENTPVCKGGSDDKE